MTYLPASMYYAGSYVPGHGYGPGAVAIYNNVPWVCTAPVAATHVYRHDDFHRPNETGGWGTSTSGHPWRLLGPGGSHLAGLSVHEGVGLLSYDSAGHLGGVSTGTDWLGWGRGLPPGVTDVEFLVEWSFDVDPLTAGVWELAAGADETWTYAALDMEQNAQASYIWTYDVSGGDHSTSGNLSYEGALPPLTRLKTRARKFGDAFMTHAWVATDPEPTTWEVSFTQAGVEAGDGRVIFNYFYSSVSDEVYRLYDIKVQSATAEPSLDTARWTPLQALG